MEEDKEKDGKAKDVVFTVDGETVVTVDRTLTADEILRLAGLDPSVHYLVEIRGREQVSYQGRGGEEIKIHPHHAFVSAATGPTPVSNVSTPTGVETFVSGLAGLGLDVALQGDFAVFDWEVPVGARRGEHVRIALQLPADLPASPPPGPHVSPRLGHPDGAVHPSPLGPEWEYWSRPFPNWPQSQRNAASYMAHVRHLFDQL